MVYGEKKEIRITLSLPEKVSGGLYRTGARVIEKRSVESYQKVFTFRVV